MAQTIALGIPHTPWVPERVTSHRRLMTELRMRFVEECTTGHDLQQNGTQCPDKPAQFLREFTDREPNWSWAHKLWQWGLDTGADYLLQLQDDVIVNSEFWTHLHQMLDTVSDQVIGLESVHPAMQMLYDGGCNWYTTSDGLIGVGYVIPRPVLKEFLSWRVDRLRPDAYKQVSEDTLIDMFCMSTGRRVYHPTPTIIDHDVDIKSTYGNDWHTHRRPPLTTVRGAASRGWTGEPRHLGRFYELTARMCRRFVKGFHADDMIRVLADRGVQ